jgi:hypothetical protein
VDALIAVERLASIPSTTIGKRNKKIAVNSLMRSFDPYIAKISPL